MSGRRELEGATALVTGATSGIGKAAAEQLSRHGADVIVHGRDPARGVAVACGITAGGGKARFAAADLGDPAQLDDLVRQAGSVLAMVLTIAGQAIVERPDVRALFETRHSIPATFPVTLPLAGAAFTAMLQLSLVCERWPLGGTGRLRSGIAALALSWAAGTGAYFLFANTSAVPAAERAAAGLRNPGGPVAAPDFGSALIAVGLWQAVLFIALRGWPVNTITRRPARLLAGNALVIGLGAVTYLVLRDLAHWQPDAISAACGCTVSAALIVAMLFEGWPAARLPPGTGRRLTLALTGLVALALDRALAAYAGSVGWTRASPDDWITTATLSFIGADIILHVDIGLRWPFARQATNESS